MRPVLPALFLSAALAALAFAEAPPATGLPPVIPRDLIFGNPERSSPQLSPDGARLAWLAPDPKNVLQVWVQTVGKDDAKVVTADKKRGIRSYQWAWDNRTLLYNQDNDGDENFHVFGVDLSSGLVRDLTPFPGARASVVAAERKFPGEILVSANARDRTVFDVYRCNLETGALVLDTKNPGDVSGWEADADFKVRLAQVALPDGGTELRVRATPQDEWKSFLKVSRDEILNAIGFNAAGDALYLQSSLGRDTAALVSRPLAGGADTLIAASDEVDAEHAEINPDSRRVEAVAFAPGRMEWKVVDPAVQADFDGIKKLYDGDFTINSRTAADDVWLVAFVSDKAPVRYYRWDRKKKAGEFLFSARPKLDGTTFAQTKPIVITTRDGLKMHAYLTLPPGVPAKGLPMVLNPHGGPWARDVWGFNPTAQWLANRGYAVLQPNFRGSTGYGKKFLNAGNKQWGLKMHDDLIDCVNWSVKEGVADAKRIGIMGGSYGGYCALAGVTYTPETFACSVDIVGPSNLKTLIGSIPPYWKPIRSMFDVRMGNVDDPADAELIRKASPLTYADKIVRPLLIGQGANDPRVNQAESEQIVAAIEKNKGSAVYVLYPDEGHGFARPENRLDFNARTEQFLAAHLGGRLEPLKADKVPGSTAIVRVVGDTTKKVP